ncbi:phage tail tape measure protein [Govanella unica]|uniref:Phage tail tape measure protein n=1 Tax=Govanella unica TaxID=2975056 RepID=A0A9X3TWL5_9PROT|nr:phage tail tape measure protein [Govania unica]MDA5192787.1 phage tail tape measure protein [Govania unica]
MDRNLRIKFLLEAIDKVTAPLRDISTGSGKAGAAVDATRARLKELDQTTRNIAGFRQLKQDVETSAAQMRAAETRATELGRQLAQTATPTAKLRREFEQARREALALRQRHEGNSTSLQAMRQKLNDAGISTRNLASHERDLRTQTARTNTELQEQADRLRRITDRESRLAAGRAAHARVQGIATGMAVGGATSMATGAAMGAPLLASAKQAMEFESVMTDIAQKADLGRAASRKMGTELIKAATAANQFPASLQQGVDVLAGFGLDPRQATQMMEPIGRAATAYKAEIADLSTASFASIDNLKVPFAQTARVLDIMAQAGKSGAFEIKDMAQHFPALTAASQALGQQGAPAVADLAAALQIVRKGAGDSASAANNLQNLLNKINSKDAAKNFATFGVDLPAALAKAAKDGKTPIEAITELTSKALGGDMAKLSHLFNDAQVQAALRPLMQNLEQYRQIRAEALGAKGVVDTDFADRLKDGAEQAKAAEISSQKLALTLGAMLLPTVNAIIGKLTALANRLASWAEQNPRLAKTIAWIAGILAGILVVLGGLAIAIAGVLAPFAALSFIAGALGMALLPVLGIAAAVVAGIALVVAAGYLVYNNWDQIAGFFKGIWDTITATFTSLFAMPGKFIQLGIDTIKGFITGIASMIPEVGKAISNVATRVVSGFKSLLGIHSPSRVFAGLGGFMMDGLSQGLATGQQAPLRQITTLAGGLAGAFAVGSAGAAPATTSASASQAAAAMVPQVSASTSYNITINANGTGAQDIGRQVREAIEQIEREKAGRAFRDR